MHPNSPPSRLVPLGPHLTPQSRQLLTLEGRHKDIQPTPPSPQPSQILRLDGRHGEQIFRVRQMSVELRELGLEMCVLAVPGDRCG